MSVQWGWPLLAVPAMAPEVVGCALSQVEFCGWIYFTTMYFVRPLGQRIIGDDYHMSTDRRKGYSCSKPKIRKPQTPALGTLLNGLLYYLAWQGNAMF